MGLSSNVKKRNERIFEVLSANGPLTRREIASAMGVSPASISDYVRPLVTNGKLIRGGEGADLRYFLPDQITA